MHVNELTELWDAHVRIWMKGEKSSDERLLRWQETYSGKVKGAVDLAAMPEPWIGDPAAAPGVVLMGMNPGSVNKAFQHQDGLFPKEIEDHYGRSWANWAKSSPYLRDPWRSANEHNPYWSRASTFVEAWASRPIPGAATVCFELYPWHSQKWQSTRFRLDDGIVRRFILDPIASIPRIEWAVGQGVSWWNALERLAKLPGWARLGCLGGPDADPCPSGVAHRRWLVVCAPTGLKIAAMRLNCQPVWPTAVVVPRIREALTAIANQ